MTTTYSALFLLKDIEDFRGGCDSTTSSVHPNSPHCTSVVYVYIYCDHEDMVFKNTDHADGDIFLHEIKIIPIRYLLPEDR